MCSGQVAGTARRPEESRGYVFFFLKMLQSKYLFFRTCLLECFWLLAAVNRLQFTLDMRKHIISCRWKSRGRYGSRNREISSPLMSLRSRVLPTPCRAFLCVAFILRPAPFLGGEMPARGPRAVCFPFWVQHGRQTREDYSLQYEFFSSFRPQVPTTAAHENRQMFGWCITIVV